MPPYTIITSDILEQYSVVELCELQVRITAELARRLGQTTDNGQINDDEQYNKQVVAKTRELQSIAIANKEVVLIKNTLHLDLDAFLVGTPVTYPFHAQLIARNPTTGKRTGYLILFFNTSGIAKAFVDTCSSRLGACLL